jgi:hypothetical protein
MPEASFMTWHSSLALCIALVTVPVAVVAAEKKPEPLTIALSARLSSAKSDVIVRARVEPDARSRELTIEWVADDLSGGSHAIAMDGARAAVTHQYALKGLAPGAYQVTAILRFNDNSEVRRASTLMVYGAGGPDAVGASDAAGSAARRVRPASQP